ncbi:AbaSI family restriction endonuclease [Microbacterium sp.]|uniref:AbaSI family restriction endonuclease n=1 Tax=Microbacterium sp. TaxID=51671 RepID=UPI003A8FD921
MREAIDDAAGQQQGLATDEANYYAQMLRKIAHKKYEYYAISRIFHRLDDPEIEMVTQQLVRADGQIALLDLYFPQFGIGVEVDELHHLSQQEADRRREQVVLGTGSVSAFIRIDAATKHSRAELDQEIDRVVDVIRVEKSEGVAAGTFRPFSFGERSDPQTWIERGTLSIGDDARFRTIADATQLFGFKGYRRGFFRMADGRSLWFPTLYQEGVRPRSDWRNTLFADGSIEEEALFGGTTDEYEALDRIVFARYTDPVLGNRFFRFQGVYQLEHQTRTLARFVRTATQIEVTGKRPTPGCLGR